MEWEYTYINPAKISTVVTLRHLDLIDVDKTIVCVEVARGAAVGRHAKVVDALVAIEVCKLEA